MVMFEDSEKWVPPLGCSIWTHIRYFWPAYLFWVGIAGLLGLAFWLLVNYPPVIIIR